MTFEKVNEEDLGGGLVKITLRVTDGPYTYLWEFTLRRVVNLAVDAASNPVPQ